MCKCFIFSIGIVGKNKYSVRGEALFIPTNVAQWWMKQKTINFIVGLIQQPQ